MVTQTGVDGRSPMNSAGHGIGAWQRQFDGLAGVLLGEVELAAGDGLRSEHASRQRDRPVRRGVEPQVAALGEPEPLDGLAQVPALLSGVVGHSGASRGSSRTRIVASATWGLGYEISMRSSSRRQNFRNDSTVCRARVVALGHRIEREGLGQVVGGIGGAGDPAVVHGAVAERPERQVAPGSGRAPHLLLVPDPPDRGAGLVLGDVLGQGEVPLEAGQPERDGAPLAGVEERRAWP